jgi:hypothetical protein
MPFEGSCLGMHAWSGVKPSVVGDFLDMALPTMLTAVSLYSPRLSGSSWLKHELLPYSIPFSIIINLLSFLARITVHSSSSGHAPPTLFTFVRWQDAPNNVSSSSFGDGPGSGVTPAPSAFAQPCD